MWVRVSSASGVFLQASCDPVLLVFSSSVLNQWADFDWPVCRCLRQSLGCPTLSGYSSDLAWCFLCPVKFIFSLTGADGL